MGCSQTNGGVGEGRRAFIDVCDGGMEAGVLNGADATGQIRRVTNSSPLITYCNGLLGMRNVIPWP